MIKAYITPTNYDNCIIEVNGVLHKSKFAVNRMAKALHLAGFSGDLEVYGPSTDGEREILRMTVDIKSYSNTYIAEETNMGFRTHKWAGKALLPVEKLANELRKTLA